jgi:outer membrane lipoprotein-sorting protein
MLPLSPQDPRPPALLSQLDARAAGRESMRGTLRFAVDAEDLRVRGLQRVAARRPAWLRVEVLGLLNQIAAVLATDGHSYDFLDAGSGRRERGTMSRDLLWQVARVDLEPEEAVSLLLGASEPSAGLFPGPAVATPDGGIRVLLLDDRGRARQRFAFDPEGRLRRLENWSADGALLWEARYQDYRDLAGSPFAHQVELRFPRTGARAEFRFRSVELNPTLPDELFVLKLPERVSSAPGGRAR